MPDGTTDGGIENPTCNEPTIGETASAPQTVTQRDTVTRRDTVTQRDMDLFSPA